MQTVKQPESLNIEGSWTLIFSNPFMIFMVHVLFMSDPGPSLSEFLSELIDYIQNDQGFRIEGMHVGVMAKEMTGIMYESRERCENGRMWFICDDDGIVRIEFRYDFDDGFYNSLPPYGKFATILSPN